MAERPFRVGAVLSPRGWATRLHALATDHVASLEVVVVRDRLAVSTGELDLLVVDDGTPWLTPSLLAELSAAGVTVVGVWDPGEPVAQRRLGELGIRHRIATTVGTEEMLFLLERLRPTAPNAERATVEAWPHLNPVASSTVVAVGGAPGAGAREVAIGMAAEIARHRSVALVDLNELSPGVARRLGLALVPNVLTVTEDLLPHGRDALAAAARRTDGSASELPFTVVAGLLSPSDWTRLSVDQTRRLLDACRQRFEVTFVTTSPIVEDLRRWGDRFAVSRSILAEDADQVIGVCEATPRGVLRFADWLVDAGPPGSVHAVLNKAKRSRVALADLTETLDSLCGDRVRVVGSIPDDRRVANADWNAKLVPHGPFTRAVAAITNQVIPARVSAAGDEGRRLNRREVASR